MSSHTPPVRFRSEVRTTAVLAAPLVAGHLPTGSMGFVDSVIAGHHGTNTLAAVAVGTALFWLPMMIPMGTLMALPASVSQLNGADRRDEIGPLFRQALWLSVALGVLLFGFLRGVVQVLEPMGIGDLERRYRVAGCAGRFFHQLRISGTRAAGADACAHRRPALG